MALSKPIGALDVRRMISAFEDNDIPLLRCLRGSKRWQNLDLSETDEKTHNAFYYAIRSGSVELLEILIEKWSVYDSNNPDRLQRLDNLLSAAYEELKLKNLKLNEDIENFLQTKLINLRFFVDKSKISDADDWEDSRKFWVIEKLKLLNNEYSPENAKVDDKFLYMCRIIAQNLHILKQRHAYDILPWEGMEFCLYAFVSSHTKKEEINFFYNATLNKQRLLKHLKNFQHGMENLSSHTGSDKNKNRGTPSENIQDILKISPDFESLFSDYRQIKDIYSLERMKHYITEALFEADDEVRSLAVDRALQVIGEYVNDSPKSPHLSEDVSGLIFACFRKEQKQRIINMRNALSHATLGDNYIFEKRAEARRRKVDFSEDLEQLIEVIEGIISNRKYQMLTLILDNLSSVEQCSSKQAEIDRIFENVDLQNFNFDYFSSRVGKLANNFIDMVKKHLPKLTDIQEKLISDIQSNLDLEAIRTLETHLNYVMGISLLRATIAQSMFHISKYGLKPIRKDIISSCYTKLFVAIDALFSRIDSESVKKKLQLNYLELTNIAYLKNYTLQSIEIYKSYFNGETSEAFYEDRLNSTYEEIKQFASFEVGEMREFTERVDELNAILVKDSGRRSKEGDLLKAARKAIENSDSEMLHNIIYKLFAKERKSKQMNQMLEKIQKALELIRNEDENEKKKHFENRLELLQKLVTNVQGHENLKNSALETVLIDILAYLEEILSLFDKGARSTTACLDKNIPVLTGKQIRNYLAHGNALLNILPSNPSIAVLNNIREILNNQQMLLNSRDCRIAQTGTTFFNCEQNVNKNIQSLITQRKMFAAAESNNVEEVFNCIKQGADEDAKDFREWNMFHYAAKGNSTKIFTKFENEARLLSEDTDGNQPIHIGAL
ncbi:uncharacterized protein LOC131436201 [Malaya genurostris]|uniref:uncharacterized protein LOC131436201 n=1 Tax=Malaya genurostris TaxID=325434 RepID=UPI0026F3BBBF|nr:uncharacterized protein LOC131436201 [Malaya genurostris]